MRKINTVILVGTQRSGTTWLMQVLSQIESCRVYGEVFREIRSQDFQGDPALKPAEFYLDYTDVRPNASCSQYVEDILQEDNKITVFKVMYDQIRRNLSLFKLLSSKNVLVINIERRDIFELALSKCLARQSGIYHAEKDTVADSFELDYKLIYQLMLKEKIKSFVFPNLINFTSSQYEYFEYEHLVENLTPLISKLEGYLNIEIEQLRPKSTKWKKTSRSNKYSSIANFDEIKVKLSKSLFRDYIS